MDRSGPSASAGEAHRTEIWERVDEIVAQAPSLSALRRHRLDLLAAHRQRAAGLQVHPDLRCAERAAAVKAVAVPQVLTRIRAAVDGPLVLMKGPEAGASYAHPRCRSYRDLDILTPETDRTHAALLGAGFIEISDFGGTGHHTRPLAWPGVPLIIELHRTPHPVAGLPVPALEDLLGLTQPSRTGVDGFEGFVSCAHAVLLAAHGWAHGPLERIGHLIDVAAALSEGDRHDADALAQRWGCGRLWRTTTSCIDALLRREPGPIALRTWARHLTSGREPSVLESYLARVVAPLWALPHAEAVRGVGAELRRTALPYEDEPWTDHLMRSRQALSRSFRPLSEYRT
jgi:hypothetical protein